MRICIVTPFHWAAAMGGAEYQAKLLTEYLARSGEEVFFLAGNVASDYQPQGYKIIQLAPGNRWRKYGTFSDSLHLYTELRKLKPDVIFQQVGCAYTGVCALYARRHRCPVVWRVSSDASFTGARPRWWRRPHHYLDYYLLRYGIRSATHIVAQTDYQRALIERMFHRRHVEVIRNFHPLPTVQSEKKMPFRVVWIANLKRLKQPEVFIELARHFEGDRRVEFIVIGGAGDDPRWVGRIEDRFAELPNLDYRGQLPQEQVNECLDSAHFLVNSSLYEGFPNVFIQAWMRDVVVLSLNVDPDGVLSRLGLGRVSGDAARLAHDLRCLMENTQARKQVTQAARAYAVRYHSEQNLAQLADRLGLLVAAGASNKKT